MRALSAASCELVPGLCGRVGGSKGARRLARKQHGSSTRPEHRHSLRPRVHLILEMPAPAHAGQGHSDHQQQQGLAAQQGPAARAHGTCPSTACGRLLAHPQQAEGLHNDGVAAKGVWQGAGAAGGGPSGGWGACIVGAQQEERGGQPVGGILFVGPYWARGPCKAVSKASAVRAVSATQAPANLESAAQHFSQLSRTEHPAPS